MSECTCGGRALCTLCQLEELENDPFLRSIDAAAQAVRQVNVRRLPRTGLNSEQTSYLQHQVQENLKW